VNARPQDNADHGWFITFEGGEGSGKSTQITLLSRAFNEAGIATLVTREPGGTPGAEAVRHVLLSGAAEPLGPQMEAILFSAARSDNVEQVIKPALGKGVTVLSDRFFDSTRVYQGATGNVSGQLLSAMERAACEDCWPDLTIILDIDPVEGMKRASRRRKANQIADRFEKEGLALQEKRRRAYLNIASAEPERCAVIDAGEAQEKVHAKIIAQVNNRLGTKLKPADKHTKRDRGSAKTRTRAVTAATTGKDRV
jgi:dTMP kinase